METKGTTALVTGGASGLGLATTRRLRAAGARVIALDLPGANAAELERIGAEFAAADVVDESAVQSAVDLANSKGTLRIVVNCAGIGNGIKTTGKAGPFPLADFERVIRVNLIGTFNVIRLAATAMAGNDLVGEERGVIVNTASVAAFDGQMGQAAYSASKGGIVGMTLPIARDLMAEGIRVNTILPGIFATPMMLGAPQHMLDSLGAMVPFPKRLGDPPEYAVLALMMIENGYMNGEHVRLDGAIRMAPR